MIKMAEDCRFQIEKKINPLSSDQSNPRVFRSNRTRMRIRDRTTGAESETELARRLN